MALFNHSTRELTAKIVYYGPGLCGKTTNLKVLHGRLERAQAGKLLSLSTAQDRTIYFDLLPVELGNIKGYTVRFQLCTVPGQVFYNETRKIVLRGVDGLVFVVDSQWSMLSHNLESFQNLRENLHDEKISLESLPLVIQYNKRDLPSSLSVEALQDSLNFHSYPFVEAVASEGVGVAETFKLVSKLTFVDLLRRLQKGAELPSESTAPGERKAATLPPTIPVVAPAPPPAAETARAEPDDSAASWAVPSADGIFADLSEEPPLESPLEADVPAGSLTTPVGAAAGTGAGAADNPGSSLVGAHAAAPGAPVLEARALSGVHSIDNLRKEVEERRSQMAWRPRSVSDPGAPLDEKLSDALEEARKAAQRAARRPPPGEGEDASTQEINAARLRDRELKKLEEGLEAARADAREGRQALEEALEKLRAESRGGQRTLEEALEKLRSEARGGQRALEEALEKLRTGAAETKKALDAFRNDGAEANKALGEFRNDAAEAGKALGELRNEGAETKRALAEFHNNAAEARRALEKAMEDALAAARADAAAESKRRGEALSAEVASREEGEKAARERIAALEEELGKLRTGLAEARAETQMKVESLKSAADEATKKWAAALRRTLEEFGE
jgi:signal recognition particle receptor subunit beta